MAPEVTKFFRKKGESVSQRLTQAVKRLRQILMMQVGQEAKRLAWATRFWLGLPIPFTFHNSGFSMKGCARDLLAMGFGESHAELDIAKAGTSLQNPGLGF